MEKVSENTRVAMRVTWLALIAMALGSAVANASPEEDYELGLAAYDNDDVVAALRPLERAAAEDYAPALVLLANILDKADEDARAIELYRRGAELGSAEAELGLGGMYAAGEGVERDPAEAVRWIERAANQNHGPAIVVLADSYAAGKLDLERSEERAIEWLERGVEIDYEPARFALEKLRPSETETPEQSGQ